MEKYSNQDHYLDEETGVLKNKLGLSDKDLLEEREANFAYGRSYELSQKPLEGEFDLDHICAIHRKLFGDVYDWAGEIRDIDIAKGNSFFAHHAYIKSAAKSVFEKLAQEDYLADLDEQAFSERAAHYLGEINALHPFREGNGRTQREFISHLAYRNGYFIEWAGMSQDDMLKASIESFQSGDNALFKELILSNLQALESTRDINKETETETETERKAREEAAARAERLAQFDRMAKEAEERRQQTEQTKDQTRTLER